MGPRSQEFIHESPIPFDRNRILRGGRLLQRDGRFGEQVDDLLLNRLTLPRYDRLVVPGGAACLAGHFGAYREEEGVAEQLRFLLAVHEVRQVILIAHQDCAYYTDWLRVPPLQLESQQRQDLERAVRHVRRLSIDVEVMAFFARRRDDRVSFERVEV